MRRGEVNAPVPTSHGSTIAAMASTESRREELKAVFAQARGCTRCPQLAATRTQVVFGPGNADADLMFIGEAPGAKEDERGQQYQPNQ